MRKRLGSGEAVYKLLSCKLICGSYGGRVVNEYVKLRRSSGRSLKLFLKLPFLASSSTDLSTTDILSSGLR